MDDSHFQSLGWVLKGKLGLRPLLCGSFEQAYGARKLGTERRATTDDNWRKPIKWNRQAEAAGARTKVFCASMADVFDEKCPADARERLWTLIRMTPFLDWQLLTRRPTNIRRFLPDDWEDGYENVWLGVTAENREQALRRIPILQSIPATLRFVSAEPLLGDLGELDLTGIAWMIIGGESGAGARPFDIAWAGRLIDQSKQQAVKVFVKQLGRNPSGGGRFYRSAAGRVARPGNWRLQGRGTNGSTKHLAEECGRTQRETRQGSCPGHTMAGEDTGIVLT